MLKNIVTLSSFNCLHFLVLLLMIHHPVAIFHRLMIPNKGLVAADGQQSEMKT